MASELRPVEKAPIEGRRLLGALLAQRRTELGYTHWPAFARDRLPLTPSGNPNTRLLADIEKAYRDNFPEPRLRQLAQAYLVTYESLTAVAHLRARVLVPASPAAVPPVDETSPFPSARTVSDRPWFDEINERRVALAGRGITAPSGEQMFPGTPDDAQLWDSIGSRLDIGARVWFIADLRRRAAGRDGSSGANSHGALRRGCVAGRGVMPGLPMTPVTVYRIQRTCRLRNPAPSRTKKFWGSSRCARCGATRDGGSPGRARPGRDSDGRTRAEKSSGTRFTRME